MASSSCGLQNNVTKDTIISTVTNNVNTKEINITSTKISNAAAAGPTTKFQNQDSRPRLSSIHTTPTASMASSPGFPTPASCSSTSMSRTNSIASNNPTPRPSFHSPSPSPFRPIQSPGPQTYQNISSPVKPSPTISIANQQQQQQASQLRKKLEHSNSTGTF